MTEDSRDATTICATTMYGKAHCLILGQPRESIKKKNQNKKLYKKLLDNTNKSIIQCIEEQRSSVKGVKTKTPKSRGSTGGTTTEKSAIKKSKFFWGTFGKPSRKSELQGQFSSSIRIPNLLIFFCGPMSTTLVPNSATKEELSSFETGT